MLLLDGKVAMYTAPAVFPVIAVALPSKPVTGTVLDWPLAIVSKPKIACKRHAVFRFLEKCIVGIVWQLS